MPGSRRSWRQLLPGAALLTVGVLGAACGGGAAPSPSTTSTVPPTASSAATTTTSTSTPTTTTVPAASKAGILAGQITAVGDSVMLDYAPDLKSDLPGIDVQAAVSRQWSAGITEVTTLRSHDDLGSTVVIGLGTNGPITDAAFEQMMSALSGVTKVVFVTVFVDQSWQSEVNSVLRWGMSKYPNVALADWATLAAKHPNWLYSDHTHLPIGGPGAQALAGLVTAAVKGS